MLLVKSNFFFCESVKYTKLARNKSLLNELIHVQVKQIVCFEIKPFEIPKI